MFDVSIEGSIALDNYNITGKVGDLTAISELLPVNVTDGVANIYWSQHVS